MTDHAAHALAIANLKALYCRAADVAAGDPDAARSLFADLFTPDCTCDYGYGPVLGPAAVIDFLCTAIAGNSEWMIHMLHSPRIEIDGDRATGEWTLMAQARRRAGGELSVVFGRYSDSFRLTPDGWRIARIDFWRPA
jgi:hypothetical protein